jgi:hypothetical protein
MHLRLVVSRLTICARRRRLELVVCYHRYNSTTSTTIHDPIRPRPRTFSPRPPPVREGGIHEKYTSHDNKHKTLNRRRLDANRHDRSFAWSRRERRCGRTISGSPRMIPTNSVDQSRFPGKIWHASHTLNGPDEQRGAVPARTPCMRYSTCLHTDHLTCSADLLLCFCSARPLGCVSAAPVPERAPYRPSVACP